MTKHVHAELMAQYAQDALLTDKPWELWEFSCGGSTPAWIDLQWSPLWEESLHYRRKPYPVKTAVVNGFTVPAPLTEAPETSMNYFLATGATQSACS